MIPKKISVTKNSVLNIIWTDESETNVTLKNLRYSCPCAECNAEKETQNEGYIPLYYEEQISIKNIRVVGSYAVGIDWKDGHSTGIYNFEYLRKLNESLNLNEKSG